MFIKVNRQDPAELSVRHYITDSQHVALPHHLFRPLSFHLVHQLQYRARREEAANLGVQYGPDTVISVSTNGPETII